MNDIPETARPEGGSSGHKVTEGSDEGPSSSRSTAASVAELAGDRPSLFGRLTSLFKPRNGSSLRADIEDALAAPETGAEAFAPGERAMLNNILRLREVRVEDVMIPRADVEAVELAITLGELLTVFEASGRSRMPVYSETLDDARGMVHIRDVLGHITRAAKVKKTRSRKAAAGASAPASQPKAALELANVDLTTPLSELGIVRDLLFVPPSMLATELMARMQATRTQMALVIDEYGGTDGLVSFEDIVEMVVGDIEDEHDDEEPMFTKASDGVFLVDGKAEIEDVQKQIGEGFAPGEHGEYVDTIGGMIFNTLGRVPARGEVVQAIPGFEFHVLDADPRRVKRVRIVDLAKAERRRRAARTEQPAS